MQQLLLRFQARRLPHLILVIRLTWPLMGLNQPATTGEQMLTPPRVSYPSGSYLILELKSASARSPLTFTMVTQEHTPTTFKFQLTAQLGLQLLHQELEVA